MEKRLSFDPTKDVTVNPELKVTPAEHEVFLSFNSDATALDFYTWLEYGDGWKMFDEWRQRDKQRKAD